MIKSLERALHGSYFDIQLQLNIYILLSNMPTSGRKLNTSRLLPFMDLVKYALHANCFNLLLKRNTLIEQYVNISQVSSVEA